MKVLKYNWMADVLSKLADNNIVNKKGEPYKKAYISHIFNGRNSHEGIEFAIFEVYKERKIKQSKMIVYKKNILETEKPEAVTPGLN